MHNSEFIELVGKELNACVGILKTKGADYTLEDGDRLGDFKQCANMLGLSVKQAWAVYFTKHFRAIMKWASGHELRSEEIRGRFHDAINYLLLGLAIMEEENNTDKGKVTKIDVKFQS